VLPEELHRRPFPAHGRGLGRRGKDAAAPAAEQARGVRPRAPGQWRRAALPVVVAGAVGWLHCWLRRCGRAVAVLLPCCCPACGPCLWLPSVRPTSGSPLIRRALSFWTRAGTRAPGRAARLSCGTRPCACSFGVLIACVRVTGILPDPPLFPQACSIGCDKCATDAGGTVPLTGSKPHADKIGFRTRYCNSTLNATLPKHAWTMNTAATEVVFLTWVGVRVYVAAGCVSVWWLAGWLGAGMGNDQDLSQINDSSRDQISQHLTTPHSPRGVLYSLTMLAGCWLVRAIPTL